MGGHAGLTRPHPPVAVGAHNLAAVADEGARHTRFPWLPDAIAIEVFEHDAANGIGPRLPARSIANRRRLIGCFAMSSRTNNAG